MQTSGALFVLAGYTGNAQSQKRQFDCQERQISKEISPPPQKGGEYLEIAANCISYMCHPVGFICVVALPNSSSGRRKLGKSEINFRRRVHLIIEANQIERRYFNVCHASQIKFAESGIDKEISRVNNILKAPRRPWGLSTFKLCSFVNCLRIYRNLNSIHHSS